MATDPVDFYRIAGTWHKDKTGPLQAVRARSVVSRAYYAAVLCARDDAGITNTSKDTHQLTESHYHASGQADIANRLSGLRQLRNDADYDMLKACGDREAGKALQYAEKILKSLGRL